MPIIGEVQHNQLGRVVVSARPNSHRATARWRNGIVSLNVPASLQLPDIYRLLDNFTPRLLEARPSLQYSAPMCISLPGVEFIITRQKLLPNKILAKASLPQCFIEVGSDIDLTTDESIRAISNILCRVAQRIAPDLLTPYARKLADKIGRYPTGWAISSGFRTLGTCSNKGIISLSYALVFLPQELRDYIIYHELAHLSEMNHSQRFHDLLNSYLNGRESYLHNRLRNYSWPILRK